MVEERNYDNRRKKRTRKLWITLLAGAGLLALLAIYVVQFIRAEPTIRHDYAVEYETLTRPAGYDPNENAAPYYEQASDLLTEMPSGLLIPAAFHPETVSGDDLHFITSWIASNQTVFGLIAQAVDKPYCWMGSVDRDLGHPGVGDYTAFLRNVIYGLCYQAQLAAAAGDIQQAFGFLKAAIRVTDHIQKSGAVPSQASLATAFRGVVYRVAFDLLARHRIEPASLEDFQSSLETFSESRPVFSSAIERIRLLDIVQHSFTDNGRGNGHAVFKCVYEDARQTANLHNQMDEVALYLKQLWVAWRHPSRRETIRMIDALTKSLDRIAERTPWQLHQEGTDYERAIQAQTHGFYLLDATARGISNMLEIRCRTEMLHDALIVTLAILRYERDKGVLPDSLELLVDRGYLRSAPIDPYSGRPLVYRQTETAFTLYSVGRDFDDDAGTPRTASPDRNRRDEIFWPIATQP
jgi:hypothetical protein